MKSTRSISPVAFLYLSTSLALAFVQPQFGISHRRPPVSLRVLKDPEQEILTTHDESTYEHRTAIRAPLKYLGLYIGLGLTFPDLATASQRAKNVSGVALDFVLDTAANTNTINGQVAQELNLDVVGEALPGVGSSGTITGGHTYNLGDTQLEGVRFDEQDEPFIFMQNLTAAALPVANPASAGLLSYAFLYCFQGGVEFNWGSPNSMTDGMMSEHPSITFFAEKDAEANQAIENLSKVKIDPIPVTNLPSILLDINGVEIPALLDTGSPVTVMNSQAAKKAGIDTIALPAPSKESRNPFTAVSNRFKDAQAMAKAASEGNVLTIAGPQGPVHLLQSLETTEISAKGADKDISFGESHIYVGDIPGLAALNGIGVDAPPAIVLGLDVLRRRPKMVLRAQDNEVYF